MERQKNTSDWRERVKADAKKIDLSIAQVARRAGYEPASVYHVLNGRAEPSIQMMMLIDDILDKELNR